jgi:hypothetical protein
MKRKRSFLSVAVRPWSVLPILAAALLWLCLLPPLARADGPFTEVWFDDTTANTYSVAWGDMDGDGDLDLAVGNDEQVNRVYRNDGEGTFAELSGTLRPVADHTLSVAWGDMDGDGDLDLAVGNAGQVNRLYRNEGRDTFTEIPGALGPATDITQGMAWGDMDGDGDLDLAVGNGTTWNGAQGVGGVRLYRNEEGGAFTELPGALGSTTDDTRSVAWGDMDDDGDLDLAIGNDAQANRLYRNDGGGVFTEIAGTLGPATDHTLSVAWGDMDGDGDLDLAVGNYGQVNRLYRNGGGGTFTEVPGILGITAYSTTSVAWGDMDGDGDLDLAVGNAYQVNCLYQNDGGSTFTKLPGALGPATDNTTSVAWGDMDGDGDLDLAIGNWGQVNRLYRNETGGTLTELPGALGPTASNTTSMAWGDMDGDGDLDLAVGIDGQANRLYRNGGGATFTEIPDALGTAAYVTNNLVWGDMDGDGDLDLAVGNYGQVNRLYRNDGEGIFAELPGALGPATDHTLSVAWGDVDGDGDLDLAVGNYGVNHLYRNDGRGAFTELPGVLGPAADATTSVAWGDMDGDGDLDLAVGNYEQANRLYRNGGGGTFAEVPGILGTTAYSTTSLAWGDTDGDGDLDLAVGNWGQVNRLYRNDGGDTFTEVPGAMGTSAYPTNSVAWEDMDGDGDLDLAIGAATMPDGSLMTNGGVHLYQNDGGGTFTELPNFLGTTDNTWSMAWGDMDGDGDLDLAVGNLGVNRLYQNLRQGTTATLPDNAPWVGIRPLDRLTPGNFYAVSNRLTSQSIPITYTLADHEGNRVGWMGAFYSLNGGGQWLPAVATDDSETANLVTGTHVYTWDTFASGFFGQSDNVVVRIVAYPQPPSSTGTLTGTYRYTNTVAGPYQRPYASSTTFPFRVRGTQVRVISGTTPISNAIVYRLPGDQATGGFAMGNTITQPFASDSNGYLIGHGQIGLGDKLLALVPVPLPPPYTERYSDSLHLYYTNGTPTSVGLDAYTVSQAGVQTLTVSSAHPLLLFDLDVSLEWDAHNDPIYLQQLATDLQKASEVLYDFTNGQAALGHITIHQNGDEWLTSDVVVYATNRLRPLAIQGGVVLTPTVDPDHAAIVYDSGQIRMGATWNRYGDPVEDTRLDWQLALAHELAHYLLFQEDSYLGLNPAGLLIPLRTCTGSAMGDVYDDRNTEFLDNSGWGAGCAATLAQATLGRSEWATVKTWYPSLYGADQTGANLGPSAMPFELTTVSILDPLTPTQALADSIFYVDYLAGATGSSAARAFLLRQEAGGQYVQDLGSPVSGQDRVLARGARPGDRLCVFDQPRRQYGCKLIQAGDTYHLTMNQAATWTPLVQVSPVTSQTIAIAVSGLSPGLTLRARLYPEYGYGSDPITLAYGNSTYSGTFANLPYPAIVGHVQVWAGNSDDTWQQVVAAYTIGGNPGDNPFSRGHGPFSRGHGPFSRGHGPFYRGRGAFAVSPDGQMSLFTPSPDFAPGAMYTIQAADALPPLPPGKLALGSGYRLVSSATPLTGTTTVSFQYLGIDALKERVDEEGLTIHFWDGTTWRALDTVVDSYTNMASARSQGDGLYALLAGVATPVISAVTPSAATNNLATTLVISGSHFLAPVEVALVGPTASYSLPVVAVSPLSVTAVVSAGLPAREYQVVVHNRLDGTASNPATFALYAPAPPNTCFYDFFDSGASKWQRSGDWDIVTILPGGQRAMTDSPLGPYKSAGDYGSGIVTYTTAITSQAFNLSACTPATLTFRHDYLLAKIGLSQDIAKVEISTDGGTTWAELARYSGGGIYGEGLEAQDVEAPEWANVSWKDVEIGLSGYSGVARLRFSLEVDQNASDKGWILDDVMVRGERPPGTSVFLPIILKQ